MIKKYGIKILYEDNHLLVVIKPFGIPVQQDASKDPDMLTLLKEYLKIKYNKPGKVFLGLVHRLDRPAGGVMVFARTSKAAARLSEQIRNREVEKIYKAIVVGTPRLKKAELKNNLIKNHYNNFVKIADINREEGKFAHLEYECEKSVSNMSLVNIRLFTGRFHQIRVQFSAIEHPLIGDTKYGGPSIKGFNGITLWANHLKFRHPITKEELCLVEEPPRIYPWNLFYSTNIGDEI